MAESASVTLLLNSIKRSPSELLRVPALRDVADERSCAVVSCYGRSDFEVPGMFVSGTAMRRAAMAPAEETSLPTERSLRRSLELAV